MRKFDIQMSVISIDKHLGKNTTRATLLCKMLTTMARYWQNKKIYIIVLTCVVK